MSSRLVRFVAIWIAFLFFTSLAQASPSEETPQQKTAEQPKLPTKAGIYYGFIEHVSEDGRLITVKPYAAEGRGAQFVLDKKTGIRRDKKKTKEPLALGQKVAVRYFAEGSVAVADAVFIVKGEFVPADYKRPKKKKPAAAPAEKAASHH